MNQRLRRLWERVGDAVTEALAQTGSVGGGTKCIVYIVPTADVLSVNV